MSAAAIVCWSCNNCTIVVARTETDAAVARSGAEDAEAILDAFIGEAEQMLEDDVSDNKAIGRHGAAAIMAHLAASGRSQARMLTHCNTGSLATAGYGTALGVVRALHEGRAAGQSTLQHLYMTETRPYNQGARLTAYEAVGSVLSHCIAVRVRSRHTGFRVPSIPSHPIRCQGAKPPCVRRLMHPLPSLPSRRPQVAEAMPATLVCDSMAASLMSDPARGIDAVVVGADRVAGNGDTANKIGTFQLAIVAQVRERSAH